MFKTPSIGTVIAWHHLGHESSSIDPTTVLAQRGYQVATIAQESEVLKNVLEKVPDLLLIYLQTSENKGYELCRNLRRLSRTRDLPIVFVGTRGEKSELVQALRCGGNEYLQMPVEEEECWLRIERHLQAVQVVRQLQNDTASLHQQIWSYNRIMRQQEQVQVSLSEKIQELQQLAFVDGLTQVANRYSFNQKICELWQQARSSRQPVSMLLCDIDYFKRYNDTYGHLGGDVCLKTVAQALVKGANRHSDQVARYGGEEFAILLGATDLQGAQQVASSVRSEIARLQIPHEKSLVKPYVSLSIGICTLVPAAAEQSHNVLIRGADEALYTAKLWGRDRIVLNTAHGLIALEAASCQASYEADSYAVPQPVPQPVAPDTLAATHLMASSEPALSAVASESSALISVAAGDSDLSARAI
jgi:two-component system, chemotaxis family, response regulator WspR